MSWVAVGIAAVGVGSAVFSATQGGPTSRSTQEVEFPEETRRFIQDIEFPLLEGAQREQDALISPFLQQGTNTFQRQRVGAIPRIAKAAARRGAKTAEVRDVGPVLTGIEGLPQELLEALRQLVAQRGAQIRTAVPPGFGTFLSPQTNVTQEGGGPDAFQTGFQAAGAAAQIASSFRSA